MMTDDKLWEMAQAQAQKEYEAEYDSWEDADKHEREDWVFTIYLKLKAEQEG